MNLDSLCLMGGVSNRRRATRQAWASVEQRIRNIEFRHPFFKAIADTLESRRRDTALDRFAWVVPELEFSDDGGFLLKGILNREYLLTGDDLEPLTGYTLRVWMNDKHFSRSHKELPLLNPISARLGQEHQTEASWVCDTLDHVYRKLTKDSLGFIRTDEIQRMGGGYQIGETLAIPNWRVTLAVDIWNIQEARIRALQAIRLKQGHK